MKNITLSWPNGATREVVLGGVPQVGHLIRQKGNGELPLLIVTSVAFVEDSDGIVVSVRDRDEGPGAG